MAGMSPTQLSLRHLRAGDLPLVEVVERWNQHARIRQDLFGIVDILAIGPGRTVAVQATSASNAAARLTKIIASEQTPLVLDAGWELWIHGWRKVKNKWTLTYDRQVTAKDLA